MDVRHFIDEVEVDDHQHEGEQEVEDRSGDANEHSLPAGMVHEGAAIIGVLFFAWILAGHLDEATERQQANLVIGVAILNAEEARTKPDREGFYADPAELGNQKVAKFVDHHHEANQDNESYCGDEKIMHKCEVLNLVDKGRPSSSGDERRSLFACLPVRSQHLPDGGGVRLGGGRKHSLNCTCNAGKRDFAVKECCDGYLVGGVQRDAVGAALFGRFVGEAETGETLKIGLFEVEMAQGCHIEGQGGR